MILLTCLSVRFPGRKRRDQRQEQRQRRVRQCNEAMMPIEACRSFIFGIDHQGMGGNLGNLGIVLGLAIQHLTLKALQHHRWKPSRP